MANRSNVCCLCLKQSPAGVKIEVSSQISRAILDIFNLNVNVEFSGSSKKICLRCHQKLLDFYIFYLEVKASHAQYELAQGMENSLEQEATQNPEQDTYDDYLEEDWIEPACEVDEKPPKNQFSQIIFQDTLMFNDEVDYVDSKETVICIDGTPIAPKRQKLDEKNKQLQKFICDLCGRQFCSLKGIKRHMLQKHVGAKNQIDTKKIKRELNLSQTEQCPDCGTFVKHLRRHMRIKHKTSADILPKSYKPKDPIFVCDLCGAAFYDAKFLKKHVQNKHTAVKHDQCQECDKSFYDSTSLKRHIKFVHQKAPPERRICPECGASVSKLTDHLKRVHGPNKKIKLNPTNRPKIKCDLCDVTILKMNICEHKRRIHKMDIPKRVLNRKVKKETQPQVKGDQKC